MNAIRGAGYIQTIFNLLTHKQEHLWSHQCSTIRRRKFAKSAQVFNTLDP